jgi:hypothetical protein
MKSTFSFFLLAICVSFAFAQTNTSNLPPGYLDQIKKTLPPGTKLPGEAKQSGAAKPLINLPAFQEPTYTPVPSSSTNGSLFGSGRTDAQRKAVLAAVNSELEGKPYILPKKENAPTKSDMLQIALNRSKIAHQKFGPNDLSTFSKLVTWIPRFDGLYTDPAKAKELSVLVSATTNYLNLPYFVLALSSAVFTLDPQSTVNANNFASAIIAAGERLNPAPAKMEALAPYRRDAESGFLYAMSVSMKNDDWTDESLTAILNLGNLYIDTGKLEEARSLFQVARKLSPFSWDAALGMAAYFHAIGKPDKALAILEDDNLDKPEKYLLAVKSAKSLEKSEKFHDLPMGTTDEVYKEGINIMTAEPILTSADFISQLDQSERNKMRYFIEHLPESGSFAAPDINKLSQYASLKAISSAQGISVLKDFADMIGIFRLSSWASTGNQRLKMAAQMGLKVDPGVDLNDIAKHPEKYANSKIKPNVKISGLEEYKANLINMSKKAAESARDYKATGNTAYLTAMAAKIDPFFTILQIDPEQYADPMNILIQKHNFTVYNRKVNLYNRYLYSVNKKTYNAVTEIIKQTHRKINDISMLEDNELKRFKEQKDAARKQGQDTESAEWKLKEHAIHVNYFNQYNNAAETGFGSTTNVVSVAYVQKIKPMAEAYYYDVIRHVGLISDPEVRNQKDADLKSSINSSLWWALQTVLIAHGSFSYSDDWDCDCDLVDILRQREGEQAAKDEEENARIARNKIAKARFDSKEIPESSQLWKRLDDYGVDFDYFFFKGRMSCARTVVNFKVNLPIPGSPELFASQSISELTGAGTYGQGVKIGIGTKEENVKVGAYLSLSSSVTTDGQGVVKDYSVTAGTGLSVKAGDTGVSVGGELTFGPNGLRDSDFSAGISRDISNELGGEGNVSFQASTKRGCSMSGKVEQSLEPFKSAVDGIKKEDYGKDLSKAIPTDELLQKELWSGKFETKKNSPH